NADEDALLQFYFDHVNKASRDLAVAFPGVVDLIHRLMSSGVPVGIATMKALTEIRAQGSLPALDIVDAFAAPPDHFGGVSKKQLVADVISQLNVGDDSGWMIGDRASDIEAGIDHGLTTVGVL